MKGYKKVKNDKRFVCTFVWPDQGVGMNLQSQFTTRGSLIRYFSMDPLPLQLLEVDPADRWADLPVTLFLTALLLLVDPSPLQSILFRDADALTPLTPASAVLTGVTSTQSSFESSASVGVTWGMWDSGADVIGFGSDCGSCCLFFSLTGLLVRHAAAAAALLSQANVTVLLVVLAATPSPLTDGRLLLDGDVAFVSKSRSEAEAVVDERLIPGFGWSSFRDAVFFFPAASHCRFSHCTWLLWNKSS